MAAPQLLTTYPADQDVGIPIGESIVLSFDRSIDPKTIKDFVVLYGADSDMTSGPDNSIWVDPNTGTDPFYLRSPGFKGVAELQARITYYDLDTLLDIPDTFTTEAAELAYGFGGAGHRVYLTPILGAFAPDTQYTLHILGDPTNTTTTGVSSKTTYDFIADGGNTGTGVLYLGGLYTGGDDVVHVDISATGDIGTAKYDWYFVTDGAGAAITDKLSNRRYRTLDKGLEIRFKGTSFTLNDIYTANVYAAERMAANTKVVFTTNDGTYTTAPVSPSTPATSSPPSTVIPPAPGTSNTAVYLEVVEVVPADGAYNVSTKTRTISILFDDTLDLTTITTDTVRVYAYPILGFYEGQSDVKELAKKLTVSGQILTVEI
jgi:hypothetical protein